MRAMGLSGIPASHVQARQKSQGCVRYKSGSYNFFRQREQYLEPSQTKKSVDFELGFS